jgi:hypothetical protein
MGPFRIPALLVLGLLVVGVAMGQQTFPPTSPEAPPQAGTPTFISPQQDPQAMTILNQVVNVAGGLQAIKAVSDYTATGSVAAGSQQGTLTLRGFGLYEFRMDLSLPNGVRSTAVHQGLVEYKSADGAVTTPQVQTNPPNRYALHIQTPVFPAGFAFPARMVVQIVSSGNFGTSYLGLTQFDGRPAYDIQIGVGPFHAPKTANGPITATMTRDFFIDPSTFEVVGFTEAPRGMPRHEVDYADFRSVGGVLMPFSISELVGGQASLTMQLNAFTFNSGLQKSAFALQ